MNSKQNTLVFILHIPLVIFLGLAWEKLFQVWSFLKYYILLPSTIILYSSPDREYLIFIKFITKFFELIISICDVPSYEHQQQYRNHDVSRMRSFYKIQKKTKIKLGTYFPVRFQDT